LAEIFLGNLTTFIY